MQRNVSKITYPKHAQMTHRQDLIRQMIPKIQAFTTHQARRVVTAPNCPRRSRLINHNNFRGKLPLLATSSKIRYPHIESEVIPLCGYIEPRQARRAKEVSHLPATAGTKYGIGDTNRHTISEPRYAYLGIIALVFATPMITRERPSWFLFFESRAEVCMGV